VNDDPRGQETSSTNRQPAATGFAGIDVISAKLPYAKKRVRVGDTTVAVVDAGEGDPVVFLHGNPTSSYLWRNVLPHVAPLARCIAPDLVGMGDSAKLEPSGPERYRLGEQRLYLDALLEALQVGEKVTLVLHDWGSVLGFDWANRHRDAVKGIVYTEAVVRPTSAEDLPEGSLAMFEALRSPAGEQLILEENMYVEQALPRMVLRKLSAEEMDAYRAPFREAGEGRRAMLTLCRELPFDGTPADVWEMEAAYAKWLPTTTFPKLFVNADPGAFLVGDKREFCRTWKNQEEVTVRGLHFVQEDSPYEIGEAVARWLREHQD
jgi:haloalkane dehalogenase